MTKAARVIIYLYMVAVFYFCLEMNCRLVNVGLYRQVQNQNLSPIAELIKYTILHIIDLRVVKVGLTQRMKPVFIEDNMSKLKAILAEETSSDSKEMDLKPVLDQFETDLKQMEDAKESQGLLILLSVLVVPLSGYLLYLGYYWPSLVLVAFVGALLYYRVNEKALSIATLKEKAKISPHSHGPKINYLLSGIQQKQDRLKLIKMINIAFWPFAVFMGQLIITEGVSYGVLWLILAVIFAVNAFFWTNHYKEQITALSLLAADLNALNFKLMLDSNEAQENVKLFAAEPADSEEE